MFDKPVYSCWHIEQFLILQGAKNYDQNAKSKRSKSNCLTSTVGTESLTHTPIKVVIYGLSQKANHIVK